MTISKAKPLQERFGFLDEELKTPAHDALMLWIDEYISEILTDVFNLSTEPKILAKRWEPTIKNGKDFLIGVSDMLVHARSKGGDVFVFIEAKPKIRSLGELIRQIRIQQEGGAFDFESEYGNPITPKWLVVSPDDRFAKTLREQGILFHKSQEP